ncbi:hypothetical protein GHJ82_24315 [Sinorhizobium saheli]|nr:hypothetical protein [Sinorhizobium saheli]MQW89890.1 hypothetical protein [Sinorhizobium saheli]
MSGASWLNTRERVLLVRRTRETESAMLDDESPGTATDLCGGAHVDPGPSEGRARGRGWLGGAFLDAVRADFAVHGVDVIARIRAEKPESYLKLVASLLPKDVNAAAGGLEELSDDQLIARIRGLDAAIRPLLEAKKARTRRSRRPARVDSQA